MENNIRFVKSLCPFFARIPARSVQWVKGDWDKAEKSFFKINQKAQPIDKTELKFLEARKKPNTIAARAIIRAGKGHKYWSEFNQEICSKIEHVGKNINQTLFHPVLSGSVKNTDLPIAGKVDAANTLSLILELVNIANDVESKKVLADDSSGNITFEYIENTKKLVEKICSANSSSLGLHPIIYFYSNTGRFRPTAFLSTVLLIKAIILPNFRTTKRDIKIC